MLWAHALFRVSAGGGFPIMISGQSTSGKYTRDQLMLLVITRWLKDIWLPAMSSESNRSRLSCTLGWKNCARSQKNNQTAVIKGDEGALDLLGCREVSNQRNESA